MRKKIFGLIAATALALPMVAQADYANTQTGTFGGKTWTAQSNVVGVTSTATIAGGGNPIYLASAPKYSGVAALIMTYQSGGTFICSGSLMTGGTAIVTAAHCVAPHGADKLVSTTAYFGGGAPSANDAYNGPGTTAVSVGAVTINAAYTGEVIDQNDIAVLALNGAPLTGFTTYGLYNGGDLTGQDFNIAGYGRRSDVGGAIGADLGPGRLRQGDNRYDFRLGDADFAGFFDGGAGGFFGTAANFYSYLSDFDNGLAANDASCQLAVSGFGLAASGKYCNGGRGALEVSTAGGDSGGPQFINGQLASVTSYGLSFGAAFGDVDGNLNSSFGEFNGFVPTFIHTAFINRAIAAGVPEASTWMQMIFGFGLIGGIARRRKTAVSALV
jgi:V8-like Glu-specific endopeptidase